MPAKPCPEVPHLHSFWTPTTPAKPYPKVPYLHGFWTPPGMGTPPLPRTNDPNGTHTWIKGRSRSPGAEPAWQGTALTAGPSASWEVGRRRGTKPYWPYSLPWGNCCLRSRNCCPARSRHDGRSHPAGCCKKEIQKLWQNNFPSENKMFSSEKSYKNCILEEKMNNTKKTSRYRNRTFNTF